MSGILPNVAGVTLMGGVILVIRKIWGGILYPQVLKDLWILFSSAPAPHVISRPPGEGSHTADRGA